MDISKLVKDLSGKDALIELATFNEYWDSLDSCAEVVRELLKLSPDCEAIFAILNIEGIKPRDFNHVFNALGNVIFTIAGETQELYGTAQVVMRTLMQKYSSFVSKALFSRNPSIVMVPMMRLLTAGVLASDESAAEVVGSLDWMLLCTVVNRRDASVERDARAWCIYFFSSLLNLNRSEHVLTQFLKTGALSLIYKGLVNDPPDRAVSILTLLKEKVLLNPILCKTLKVQLFNNTIIAPLVQLHKWVKPQGVGESFEDAAASPETLQGREEISIALSNFLTILCSSYNYGIAIPATDFKNPKNGHCFNIIKLLTVYPLVNKNYRRAVSSTLRACPDILDCYAKYARNFLEVGPNQYFMAFTFVYIELVNTIDASKLLHRNINGVIDLLIPSPVNGKFVQSILKHESDDLNLRHCGVLLLESVLTAAERAITEFRATFNRAKAVKVEKAVQNFLSEALLSVDDILSVWRDVESSEDIAAHAEKLLPVVKVLTLYARFYPSPDLCSHVKPERMLAAAMLTTDIKDEDKLQLLIACLQLISSLQSKFDILKQAKDEMLQQELLDTFKLLLTIYLEVVEVGAKEEKIQNKILVPLVDHIEKTLINYGFSARGEANLELWLEALVGRDEACLEFLCHSIIATVASIEHFFDKVVVITWNTAPVHQPFEGASTLSEQFPSAAHIEDSTDVSAANVLFSFTRLILGNLEVLPKYKSKQVHDYFSDVTKRYIQQLPDPQVLAQYLITDSDVQLPESLVHCCNCWLGRKPVLHTETLKNGASFAEIMEYAFMTKDFRVSLDVKTSVLPETKEKRTELLKTVLMYLRVDTSESADVDGEEAHTLYLQALQSILQRSCTDFDDANWKFDWYNTVLMHPVVFNRYDPFKYDQHLSFVGPLLSELSLEKEYGDNKDVAVSYFKQYSNKMQALLKKDKTPGDVDYMKPFEAFCVNEQFSLCENLGTLLNSLLGATELYFSSESYVKLTLRILQHVQPVANDDCEQTRRLFYSMKRILIELCHLVTSMEPSQLLLSLFKNMQQYVTDSMLPSDVPDFDKGQLKSVVLLARVLGSGLLLRMLELHPERRSAIVKRIRKSGPFLPGQAAVLQHLLEDEKTEPEFVSEMLDAVKPTIVAWLKNYDAADEAGYAGLTDMLLANNLIGGSDASSCVKTTYNKLVLEGLQQPPAHILALCAVCEGLKGHKKEARLPRPDALVSALHLLLVSIERLFSSSSPSSNRGLVSRLLDAVKKLLPKLQRRTRSERADPDVWRTFATKIIQNGLKEPNKLSIELLSCVGEMCVWQAAGDVAAATDDAYSSSKVLTLRDLHKLLVTHSSYEDLMIHSDVVTHGELKECVLGLQSLLLRNCAAVARDCHAGLILAAYTATTQPADQAALQLLKQYEEEGAMSQILPVVWGKAAISCYGGRPSQSADPPVFKEPRHDQVLALLDAKMLLNTCINFDRNMSYKAHVRCKVPPCSTGPVYDLRYLLPVLVFVCHKYLEVQYLPRSEAIPQIVGVAVAALAARDITLRSQAVKLIRELRAVLQNLKSDRERLFWQWLLDIICYTLAVAARTTAEFDVKRGQRKRQTNARAEKEDAPLSIALSDVPPLAGPVVRYLLETVIVTDKPGHPLYLTLLNYMFLFPSMKTTKIPEMFRLYNNPSHNNTDHARLLLLRMISDGVRTEQDFELVQRVNMPPLVLALLHSPTASLQIQLETLSAVESMLSTNKGCNRLLRHHELLHLLPSLLERTSDLLNRRSLTEAITKLLSVAWSVQLKMCKTQETGRDDSEETNIDVNAVENNDQSGEQNHEEPIEDLYGDEGDYGEYDEEEDLEEKSKLRKKRKLEAKNRKAAKKAKLDESVVQIKRTLNVNVDSLLICDIIQCLFSISSKVFQTNDNKIIQRFEDTVSSLTDYVKKKISERRKSTDFLLLGTMDGMQKHLTTLRSHQTQPLK